MTRLKKIWGGVTKGYQPVVMADALTDSHTGVFITRKESLQQTQNAITFFNPHLSSIIFDPWPTAPYDRLLPPQWIQAKRLAALGQLLDAAPSIVITTLEALTQYIMPPPVLRDSMTVLRRGQDMELDGWFKKLQTQGYERVDVVRAPGDMARRGDILDFYPAGCDTPYRLDFFGDTLERIRTFDPMTQLGDQEVENLTVLPVHEIVFNPHTRTSFLKAYRQQFGSGGAQDMLYDHVEQGVLPPESFRLMPLFYKDSTTLLSYIKKPLLLSENDLDVSLDGFFDTLENRYTIRKGESARNREERWLDPYCLYGRPPEDAPQLLLSPFKSPQDARVYESQTAMLPQGGLSFVRTPCMLTASTPEGVARIQHQMDLLGKTYAIAPTFESALKHPCAILEAPLDQGFETPALVLLTEQEIYGKPSRPKGKTRRSFKSISLEMLGFEDGDYLIHKDHGIGCYEGLEVIEIAGGKHDCLKLRYDQGARLFVPVESLDVLSRYARGHADVTLDRLGSTAFQTRKAKAKKNILAHADKLIQVAAARKLALGLPITYQKDLYEAFESRFPFAETEDQLCAIADVLDDLTSGRPMDRLICGDVGFGKTEVAMRAAFLAASSGYQVAVLVPTTLLATQHTKSFEKRFEGTPFKVAQLSRVVSASERTKTLKGMRDGSVSIVIATSGLLSGHVKFQNLGLMIVDEEQHFGVLQKEKVKALNPNVHLLTLSATPIPRTLQMSLAGIRDMTLITTPPVMRVPAQTHVLPYDPMTLRQAILDEVTRGGQVYYVCPRIHDLDQELTRLQEWAPHIRIGVVHGQMPTERMEEVMMRFAAKDVDVLLATNIVESGLDIPSANTLIVVRADLFGLSQLHQLRGRVGRSDVEGHAYLTFPQDKALSEKSKRRLEVMQTLEGLGAGFALASQDMDIRGTGNLVGDDQSGQVREVGVELYQEMLMEAISEATEDAPPKELTPDVHLQGLVVMIPETYVTDLGLRLGLYRRIAAIRESQEIQLLLDEFADRFGPVPTPLLNLLNVVDLKILARAAWVQKIDGGDKGVVFTFYHDAPLDPLKLISFIQKYKGLVRMRPDQKMVLSKTWKDHKDRFQGLHIFLKAFADEVVCLDIDQPQRLL